MRIVQFVHRRTVSLSPQFTSHAGQINRVRSRDIRGMTQSIIDRGGEGGLNSPSLSQVVSGKDAGVPYTP